MSINLTSLRRARFTIPNTGVVTIVIAWCKFTALVRAKSCSVSRRMDDNLIGQRARFADAGSVFASSG
jgi:hypothetical protein